MEALAAKQTESQEGLLSAYPPTHDEVGVEVGRCNVPIVEQSFEASKIC